MGQLSFKITAPGSKIPIPVSQGYLCRVWDTSQMLCTEFRLQVQAKEKGGQGNIYVGRQGPTPEVDDVNGSVAIGVALHQ